MAVQQLVKSKGNLPVPGLFKKKPAALDRSEAWPVGLGYLGAAHDFGNIPLFAGALNDAGASVDAGSGPEIGATRDAGAATGGSSPDAGTVDGARVGDGGSPDPATTGPVDGGSTNGGSADAGTGGNTQPAPTAACTITSKTAVHAPDRTPDTRTTIGVCETVVFEIGGQKADWSANNGWPGSRTARARFEWAAPEVPGTSTIVARLPTTGQTCSIDMTVVAPATIRMDNPVMQPIPHPVGTVTGQAVVDLHVGPRNVNFGWISIEEDPGPATNVSGYFTRFTMAQLAHGTGGHFERLDFNNSTNDTIGALGSLPGPFSAGTWDWVIPNRYRCSNSTSVGHLFTQTIERFRMTGAGAFHTTKGGTGF